MELENYILGLPFGIDDTIKALDHNEIYKVVDIQHTYSEAKATMTNVSLILRNIDTDREITIPYQTYNWVVVSGEA